MSPMRINIHYFAVLADRIGRTTETLNIAEDTTVATILDELAAQHDIIRIMRPSLAAAVDNAYVPPQHKVREGDTVSIIPPVSGG